MSSKCFWTQRAAELLAAALPLFVCSLVATAADTESGRKKSQTCVACHGPAGNSIIPAMPSLAGQPRQFIVTQLIMFREGNRKDPQMSPLAKNLTNADVNDIASYFSTQLPTPLLSGISPERAIAGRRLTEQHHCVACHGPTLAGQQHIPRLAGQQFEYLRTQLRGFKASTRFDMDGQMSSAASSLTDADIEILAEYLSGLR